jgi:acetyltransferase-like isoleucine patch superfamily enzyme
MRDAINFVKCSSLRFSCYRALQHGRDHLAAWFFSFIWRSSLGAVGEGTTISPKVTFMKPRQISFGKKCKVSSDVRFLTDTEDGRLVIGDNCVVGVQVLIDFSGGIEVGAGTEFSEQVIVYTHDHAHHDFSIIAAKPLSIGSHVRFGARSIVLPSVGEIGDNSIIGAGAVVTKPVPPRVLVVGNPARIVREIV